MPRRVVQPVQQFLHAEAFGGIALLIATIAALVWANVDASSYDRFWHATVELKVGTWGHADTLAHVVNDGLMALFFFVIGLEVKRELVTGELAGRRAIVLPLAGAIGGMLVPAVLYLVVTAGDASVRDGWGVPMATDIAFALGVLALLGDRVPAALKLLLLGIAVIDDIGAILVIAIAYTSDINTSWLLAAGCSLAIIASLNRLHVRGLLPYVVLGIFAWFATWESGIHATIAGVALGLLTPARPFQRGDVVSEFALRVAHETDDDANDPDKDHKQWRELAMSSRESISPLARLEGALHPWTSAVVLPLFALANVGIVIDPSVIADTLAQPLSMGIIVGLVLGKPLGIVAGCWLVVRGGLAQLPDAIRWSHVIGAGALAGIGFTMSLFVATLAFDDAAAAQQATIAVLAASVAAAAIGATMLIAAGRPEPGTSDS